MQIPWRKIAEGVGAVIVFAAASSLLVAWLGPEPSNTHVIEEWNATISKLGIDPVFPPEEDVAVGDIYAVLDDSENGQPSRTALALRSIKLTHQDLTENIERAYKDSYLFPDTKPRPSDASAVWEQVPNNDGIMTHPGKRTTLPLAAFPGFTIRQQGGLSGSLFGWLPAAFGFRSDRGVELNIPIAETYGIPSIEAVGELEKFCSDKDDPNRCTDETLRRHLAFVTPRAFELKPKDSGDAAATDVSAQATTNPYRFPLQVVLVNRVYLARYIDQSTTRSRSGESEIGSGRPARNAAGNAKDSTKDNAKESAKDNALAPRTGTALSAETSDGQSLKQTFLRPLAIGYRAVKRIPKDNVIDAKTDTSKAKIATKVQDCFNDPGNCSKQALGTTPPLAVNSAQVPNSTKQDSNDPKRFRLYLHTAGQPDETVARVKEALAKGGYAVQGSETDADPHGAGVDFFSDVDFAGGANVARIVSGIVGGKDPASAVVPRRQKVYNPIGVLGVWLPPPRS